MKHLPYLSPRDRVFQQRQMREPREVPQHVEIREFGKIVRRQDERRQVRQRVGERGLDAVNPVSGQQQRAQARGEGEV